MIRKVNYWSYVVGTSTIGSFILSIYTLLVPILPLSVTALSATGQSATLSASWFYPFFAVFLISLTALFYIDKNKK